MRDDAPADRGQHARATRQHRASAPFPAPTRAMSTVVRPDPRRRPRAGPIIIENYERENAFGESDVRLLSTVAASMGVALENARLFDETQRLFKESEQRAAELAIINSVQQALAAELNMQGIYDAVGDKIREIFHQADVSIRIYDPQTDLLHFPYIYESGQRDRIESRAARRHRLRRPRPAHPRDAGHQREHGGQDRAVRHARCCPATQHGEIVDATCRWSPATRRAGSSA